MNGSRLLMCFAVVIIMTTLAQSGRAQQPIWKDIPGGDWFEIPDTTIRVMEDSGRLKYWVENGPIVHFKTFESNTVFVVEDTDTNSTEDDDVDINIQDDDSDAAVNDTDGATVNVGSGTEDVDLTFDNCNNTDLTVSGDNGTQTLTGDSSNNDGTYTSSASGNSHTDNGTGSNNTFTDANGNSGPW